MAENKPKIKDWPHYCHQHYNGVRHPKSLENPRRLLEDSGRTKREADDGQWDTLYQPAPRSSRRSDVDDELDAVPEEVRDMVKLIEEVAEEDGDKEVCFPVPMSLTRMCEHVCDSPTVSIVLVVGLVFLVLVELLALVFCGMWVRRGCISCRNVCSTRSHSTTGASEPSVGYRHFGGVDNEPFVRIGV